MGIGWIVGGLLLCGLLGWLWKWRDELCRQRRKASLRGLCDTGDGAGCSLLLRHPDTLQRVEKALAVEWEPYEVVAVVDGAESGELLSRLIDHYALLRVDYLPSELFPVFGVRALYRSTHCSYRRLILLDRVTSEPEDDWSAAAGMATYEWLLLPSGSEPIRSEVVEELMSAVEQSYRRDIEGVVSGDGCRLVASESVVQAGGFGPDLWRRVRKKTLRLWSLRAKAHSRRKIFPR